MPQVRNAQQATSVALAFLGRYYYFVQPKGAKKTNGAWEVKADVGLTKEIVATVQIDATTGEITSYEFPVKPQKR
ncbi:MAG: hypothetical protein HYU30_06105 [Chloroflexi bacterium]|nr:hypothetical protein [Chloroflexota bacterium]